MKPANRVKNMAVKEKEEVNTSDERAKALKLAIDKIEKDFGKGAIMKLGDKPAVSVETIPTGALALDLHSTLLQNARKEAVLLLSLMLNTHLTLNTLEI